MTRLPRLLRALAPVSMAVLAPLGAVLVTTPAVGSAAPLACAPGEWWDPSANVCRPLSVGPQPLNCAPGEWWDPSANVCRSLSVGPQPLNCDNGWWWDPTTNQCAPPVLPPS